MQSLSLSLEKKNFLIFLLVLSLLGIILGGVATARYGAGVASDSTKYLSVAQNLLLGKGLVDHRDAPLLSWPPLYSIIIAGLSLLTHQDVFIVGWYLNVLLIGVNLFMSGVIFARLFSDNPLYAYLSTLFVFLSLSSFRIHDTISSDPLYLTITLGFLIAADAYITRRSSNAFAWMVVFGILAPLLRYIGLAVTVTAEAVIWVENRRGSIRTMLRDGFILGITSVLPIAWWLLVHNIMTYGSLWGLDSQEVQVGTNINLGLTKMLHWFVPYLSFLMPILTQPLIPLGALALMVYLINRKNGDGIRAWVRSFTIPSVYPMMLYAIIYFVAVALTAITNDHRDLFSDRYYVILLVPTAYFVLVTIDKLILPHLQWSTRQAGYVLSILFALWSLYPLYGLREYLASALERGEPSSSNLFNTRRYHEMDLVAETQKLRSSQPEARFYSNYVDAIWFYTRQPAYLVPLAAAPNPAEAYMGWPHDKPGYIIWFEPNEYKHYLSPKEISKFADLKLVFQGHGGEIYSVQSSVK